MCGIVGYFGKNSVEKKLVDSLKFLEYRGYDSAGICVWDKKRLTITKEVGKISNLEAKINPIENAILGIGHTRWATHGKATKNNAHPHISQNWQWCVVHNGIIENYSEIKNELLKNKVKFKSETDTEVIAQLLELNNNSNAMFDLIDVVKMLRGSWALACINKFEDKIFLAKNKSPLYVAQNDGEFFVASDPICFIGKATKYYELSDMQFAQIGFEGIKFFDIFKNKISLKAKELEKIDISVSKGDYAHYMIKEIHEIPRVLGVLTKIYAEGAVLSALKNIDLDKISRIKVVGCGTAYNSGVIGANYLEENLGIETSCFIASEFRYANPILNKNTLFICVSQSGETADTLACLELAKQKGAKTIAITNVAYSTAAKMADITLPICAGPEISVASTKAYVCQLAVFYCLAKHLAQVKNVDKTDYIKTLSKFIDKLDVDNEIDKIKQLAGDFKDVNKVFFIGRGKDFATSEEASLKLKEVSYINSNAYASGELKHGFLALVSDNDNVVVIATNKALLEKTLNGASESAARGGQIILVSPYKTGNLNFELKEHIKLKSDCEDLLPLEAIIPMQLLAYYTSIGLNIDPDKPRNLAKSVTVE